MGGDDLSLECFGSLLEVSVFVFDVSCSISLLPYILSGLSSALSFGVGAAPVSVLYDVVCWLGYLICCSFWSYCSTVSPYCPHLWSDRSPFFICQITIYW